MSEPGARRVSSTAEECDAYCSTCARETIFRRRKDDPWLCFTCGNPLKRETLTASFEEGFDQCDVCGKEALFRRHNDEPWFCTTCRTQDARAEDVSAPFPVRSGAAVRRASREGTSSSVSEQGDRKKPLPLVMCAVALLVFAIIFALGQVTAHGDGQPRATATPDPRSLQYGDVHLCQFSQYNASTLRCLSNSDTIDNTGQHTDQIVWSVRQRGSIVATIQVLQQNGRGSWQVIGSAAPNALAAHSADGSMQSETVQTLFADAGVVALCNARYLIRVVTGEQHQFGQVPVTASC